MRQGPFSLLRRGAPLRIPVLAAVLAAAASTALAASGAASASAAVSTRAEASAHAAARSPVSCAGVAGAHHARVVVEVSAKDVVQRCVGFSSTKIAALKLLKDSRIQVGTETDSYGVEVCQVDHVPRHYSECLSATADYWALFVSPRGHGWTTASVGVSEISVPAGGSLGLRYDSSSGTPAPPPKPAPA